jgi:hypothetical protein
LALVLGDDEITFAKMILLIATGETAGIYPGLFRSRRNSLKDFFDIKTNQGGLQKCSGAVVIGERHAAQKDSIGSDVSTGRSWGATITRPGDHSPTHRQENDYQRLLHTD